MPVLKLIASQFQIEVGSFSNKPSFLGSTFKNCRALVSHASLILRLSADFHFVAACHIGWIRFVVLVLVLLPLLLLIVVVLLLPFLLHFCRLRSKK